MGFLDDRQLGVGVADGKVGVRSILGAVKEESPLADVTRLGRSINEGNLQRPLSSWILGPGVGCHEGPFGEAVLAVVVIGSLR